VKTEALPQLQDSKCLVFSREWLPLSYDVWIGHVSVAKAGIGDRQHEEAETESVPRCVLLH